MNEEGPQKFSWSTLFFVTACCSLLFNIALKFLNNYYSNIILVIGCGAFLGGILNIVGRIIKVLGKKKTNDNSLTS